MSSFDGQLRLACPGEDRGIPAKHKHIATAQLQRAIEDLKRRRNIMAVICEDERCDRERRRIVIAEGNRSAGMANCSQAILLTQSSASKAGMVAPAQICVRCAIVGLKLQCLLKQRNRVRCFLWHAGKNELLGS